MGIHMKSLSPETYSAMEQLCEKRFWAPIYEYMEPEHVAWLAVKLAHVSDDPATFPKGKWATIQRIQDLVDDAAKREVINPLQ